MQYKVQWYALRTAACCAIATCIRLGHVHAAVTTPITTNAAVCVLAVRGDLIRILNKLLKRKSKFDAIMIETTGLANPAPVIQVNTHLAASAAGTMTAVCCALLHCLCGVRVLRYFSHISVCRQADRQADHTSLRDLRYALGMCTWWQVLHVSTCCWHLDLRVHRLLACTMFAYT
jgi:hypothetical protein